MPTNTNVNSLVINKLTKAQYDAIQNPINALDDIEDVEAYEFSGYPEKLSFGE